jgi:hypothetical protein
MPGYLIDASATVNCAHPPGQAQPTLTSPRVSVGGQPVVTQPPSWTVSSCTLPAPPNGNGPCATARWTPAPTRVRVGGQAVLLSDASATCLPSGTPLVVAVTQVRVKGT